MDKRKFNVCSFRYLHKNHLIIWKRFVLASRILCQPVIMKAEIMKADALLLNFCKGFQQLYGKLAFTPNMNLCCHIKDSRLDFRPVYAFWLFFFERYNGKMASNVTNNRSVENQYMRKFITSAHVHPRNDNVPSTYKIQFEELFYRHDPKEREHCVHQRLITLYYNSSSKDLTGICWEDTINIKPTQ